MKTQLKHGVTMEHATPAEVEAIIRAQHTVSKPTRIRAAESILLDGAGNGQDEIYTVPPGYEFEARRVALDLDTANLLNTALGTKIISQQLVAPATTGNPVTVDVSNYGKILLVAYNDSTVGGSGAATAGADVDIFFRTTPLGNHPAVILAAIIPGATSTNSISGANASRIYQVDVSGLQTLSVYPRNNNAANILAIDVDLYSQGAEKAGQIALTSSAVALDFLRSGTRIEYAMPAGPTGIQIPGVQTWGAEQGPYLRNGEVFEVRARGLTPNARLVATLEGILNRPEPHR